MSKRDVTAVTSICRFHLIVNNMWQLQYSSWFTVGSGDRISSFFNKTLKLKTFLQHFRESQLKQESIYFNNISLSLADLTVHFNFWNVYRYILLQRCRCRRVNQQIVLASTFSFLSTDCFTDQSDQFPQDHSWMGLVDTDEFSVWKGAHHFTDFGSVWIKTDMRGRLISVEN